MCYSSDPHTGMSSRPPQTSWLRLLAGLGCFVLCTLALPAMASARQGSSIQPYSSLSSLSLTNTAAHHQLERIVRPRDVLDNHQRLHALCHDVRRRERARHWVFPTIKSISRIVTHNGVVVVENEEANTNARLLPTLSLSTVGARLRVHF